MPPVVTPDPDQVPPDGVPVRLILELFEQTDCEATAETGMTDETVTFLVAALEQPLEVTVYVKVLDPRLAVVGINVPDAETPVPDQVPPAGENPVNAKGVLPEQVETLGPAEIAGLALTVITN